MTSSKTGVEVVMGFIDEFLGETVRSMTEFQTSSNHARAMTDMAGAITGSLRRGRKLMVCGNGGSAGDAQHIAGEFISRLMFDRAPLAAIALTTDTSVITATGNDYGYQHIFERQVLGLGQEGDVLLAISTSGNSPNVCRALTAARTMNLVCIGFTGESGGAMGELCDLLLEAPSSKTAIIQQVHIVAAHIVCALVERDMFPQG